MAKFYFGKDLSVGYTYGADAVPVGSPTIYLFRNIPGRDAARAGTGALQTISSWTADADLENTKTFTVAAFTDPDISSVQAYDDYYLAINYTLKSGAESQCDIKKIRIIRPGGSVTHHGVTVDAIVDAYPTLAAYLKDDEIEDQLNLAIIELRAALEPRIEWEKVTNKDELYFPILCKAIANSCLSEFQEEGDRLYKRYEIFEKKYADFMAAYAVKSDEDVSGDSETTVIAKQDFILSYR